MTSGPLTPGSRTIWCRARGRHIADCCGPERHRITQPRGHGGNFFAREFVLVAKSKILKHVLELPFGLRSRTGDCVCTVLASEGRLCTAHITCGPPLIQIPSETLKLRLQTPFYRETGGTLRAKRLRKLHKSVFRVAAKLLKSTLRGGEGDDHRSHVLLQHQDLIGDGAHSGSRLHQSEPQILQRGSVVIQSGRLLATCGNPRRRTVPTFRSHRHGTTKVV
mmetsp:Transcript_16917/g.45851  ORF Transcript_16917/g.45851 Transcript_16917/m.45851 type:complete len:221 (-) Transcript_16917:44-706(-)